MHRPPAWTIERGAAHVFLFGVKPGARDTAWVTETIRSALAESDEFWRETPPEDDVISSPLFGEGALSPGEPLSSRLDDVTRRRLDGVAKSLEIDVSTLEPLRPSVVDRSCSRRH